MHQCEYFLGINLTFFSALYIMLAYFAIDFCIAIIYFVAFFPCFVFGLFTHGLFISIIALHHIQRFLVTWFCFVLCSDCFC